MILSKNINKFYQKILKRRIEKTNLKYLLQALDEVYPDRWDLQFNVDKRDVDGDIIYNDVSRYDTFTKYLKNRRKLFYDIVIHYPEVIITNGKLQHKLTDLYVNLFITDLLSTSGMYVADIAGTRASQTVEEIQRGYRHSHLSIIGGREFTDFCLGSGPLHYTLYKTFNSKEECVYFLLLLDNYLKWESKSGVPYVFMDSIRSTEPRKVATTSAKSVIDNIKFNDINFKITASNIEVINDTKLEQRLFEYLNSIEANTYLCYKTTEGRYITNDKQRYEQDSIYLDNTFMPFTFKGKKIKFKITNTENIINYEYNAPNPNLTKEVCKQLSKQITKKHITNSRITKEDRVEDTQESISSDTVSV